MCIAEFKKILAEGHNNIMITADNVGAYGLDINKTIVNLLDNILQINGNFKIGIDDFHDSIA